MGILNSTIKMEFGVIDRDAIITAFQSMFSCVFDYWNDYSFVNQFRMTIYDELGVSYVIGDIKIDFKD